MKKEDYPLILNTFQMMEILQCSREKFYEYARRKDFPRLQGHRHIKAPRDLFFEWLENLATQRQSTA